MFERLHMPVEMAESTIEVREDALDCLALPTARGEECEEAGTVTASDAPREREREREIERASERERERELANPWLPKVVFRRFREREKDKTERAA